MTQSMNKWAIGTTNISVLVEYIVLVYTYLTVTSRESYHFWNCHP